MSKNIKLKVAHFDDDSIQLALVQKALQEKYRKDDVEIEFELKSSDKVYEFLELCEKYEPDIALLDLSSEIDPADTLVGGHLAGEYIAERIRKKFPQTTIIFRSSLDEPIIIAKARIRKIVDNYISKNEDTSLPEIIHGSYKIDDLDKFRVVKRSTNKYSGETIDKISNRMYQIVNNENTNAVFLTGESGTGKEVAVEILEGFLKEKNGNKEGIIKVNCAAITPTLMNSELFGHKKGAFTGADKDKDGYFVAASKGSGWIFLDEISHLPYDIQTALLRVVANGQLTPLGESKPINIDVKVITATSKDLEKQKNDGQFEEDLYNRLMKNQIYIPPFRKRSMKERGNILDSILESLKDGPWSMDAIVREMLIGYPWAGDNIRIYHPCREFIWEHGCMI